MTLEYSIHYPSMPSYMSYHGLRDAIASGLSYVNRVTSDRVKFRQVPYSLQNGSHVVHFGFEDYGPEDDSVGNWELNNGRHSVSFNTRYKWRTHWLQMLLGRNYSIRDTTIHEVGHLLGLPHSDDYGSVMHSEPKYNTFTSNDLASMIYRINRKDIRWQVPPP